MTVDRYGLGWAVAAGTVGAVLAVLLLEFRYGSRSSVVLGFTLGVATAGLTLALALFAWVALSEVDGDSLYPAAAGVLSGSLLTLGVASSLPGGLSESALSGGPVQASARADPRTAQILLVGAGVLVTVGFALLFLSELTTGER
ncbi:MAG: hypothetical protein J07HX64_01773 [halophilic archaeon J07HX64]|jgi:hypothetical protein|nr:MAG: hypothetical protein J07HX64_01773 [halophilic archaeon J07HX64]